MVTNHDDHFPEIGDIKKVPGEHPPELETPAGLVPLTESLVEELFSGVGSYTKLVLFTFPHEAREWVRSSTVDLPTVFSPDYLMEKVKHQNDINTVKYFLGQ